MRTLQTRLDELNPASPRASHRDSVVDRFIMTVIMSLFLLALASGCGRAGGPSEQKSSGDAGPAEDGGGGPQVQIIRTPGKLEGSPSLTLFVPRLDGGAQVFPLGDGGSGPISE